MGSTANSASTSRPRVVVFHPTAQHSHYLAVGVQRAGILQAYVTQLYFDDSRFPFKLIRRLPRQYRQAIERLLQNRRHPELDVSRVLIVSSWAEWFYILMNRLHIAPGFRQRWLRQAAHRFSRRVGQLMATNTDILIGTDTASCAAFKIAKQHGVICVLDMSSPHILTTHRIREREAEAYPQYAHTFGFAVTESDDLMRCRREVELADYFFVASSFARQSLVENGVDPERIFVNPYGVDIDLFQPNGRTNTPHKLRLLFAARVSQLKGFPYLLEAVHELRQLHPEITLVVCGNVIGDLNIYEKYADDFEYIGLIPHTQMNEVYRQADVFVFPTLVEGFARVLVEAMASGLPLITTPHSCAPDIVSDGEHGFIVPVCDVQALKERILYMFHHPEERKRMGINARRAAEQLTWENYYTGIQDALQAIWSVEAANTGN